MYMRPGCHLCAEAVALAQALRDRHGLTVREVDIERDDELHRRYLEAIPVVTFGGRELTRLDGHRHGGLEAAIENLLADVPSRMLRPRSGGSAATY